MPRVATKGCSFILATRIPFTSPRPKPMAAPARTAAKGFSPMTRKLPTLTITIASVEPTVKSIPAVMMTRVMPIARRPLITDWSRISSRLDGEK